MDIRTGGPMLAHSGVSQGSIDDPERREALIQEIEALKEALVSELIGFDVDRLYQRRRVVHHLKRDPLVSSDPKLDGVLDVLSYFISERLVTIEAPGRRWLARLMRFTDAVTYRTRTALDESSSLKALRDRFSRLVETRARF